ncbi:membrane-associated protease RseP (regulator of RpoE activity) [Chryseomicrobium aureum]|uniref:site-2 protease family protein n=1 Tax=Chryseomicrobium aureum TaxID=1441723 RepID=UPI00195A3C92|nr:site-2 protease family protein [Chryseomicrobium aureum]MBM7706351.1 membrane-associated protease RseP (regulator of RpoE activity) [Chryseomicrobium aureum]
MASDLLNLMMYIVYLPIIILIHELGHAAFVVLFGRNVTEVSIGRGEEAFRFGKFVLYKSRVLCMGRYRFSRRV